MNLLRIFTILVLCSISCISQAMFARFRPIANTKQFNYFKPNVLSAFLNRRIPSRNFKHRIIQESDTSILREVTIRHGRGDVIVEGCEQNTIDIQIDKKTDDTCDFSFPSSVFTHSETTIQSTTEVDDTTTTNTMKIDNPYNSAIIDLFIRVPQQTRVTASTEYGRIYIKNVLGKVRTTTEEDYPTLIKGCKSVHAQSNEAPITIRECKSVDAHSKSGNIYLKNMKNKSPESVKASSDKGMVVRCGNETHFIVDHF